MIGSPGLGSKTVHTGNYSKEEYSFALESGVVGVLKSPYEDRVAIVMVDVNRGWEGPPHTGDVRIIGASLRFP
jgi:hypothetical protein